MSIYLTQTFNPRSKHFDIIKNGKRKSGRNLSLLVTYATLHHYCYDLTPQTSNYKKWPKLYLPLSGLFGHAKMVSSKYAFRLNTKHCIGFTSAKLHASSQVKFKAILVGESLDLFCLKTVLESM